MAKRRKTAPEEPRQETRKQVRIRLRDQKRNRRLMMIVGAAIVVALLLIVAGVVSEAVIKPRSVLARVADRPIITRDFWERALLRKSELETQLQQLQIFSQQFGDQNVFASQIAQIQTTLSSPLSLGTQVVNEMIEDEVVRVKAEELGVTVSDEEVEEALREEIARAQGAVTVAQATATAEAAAAATATATSLPPTPAAEEADGEEILEPEEPGEEILEGEEPADLPTPEQPPLLDDAMYEEGLATLGERLRNETGLTLAEYREIIRTQLLREKLQQTIGEEQVDPTEEQVNVRHILIRVDETSPAADAEEGAEGEAEAEEAPAAEGEAEAEDGGLDDGEALALAEELRERILAGEDFAELAREYSDDPGSGMEGGALGWVGRGAFVPEFEEVAFTLPVGEISEPVKTQFGYHLIEVVERDEERPKEEAQLSQERAQAFQQWLQEQILSLEVQRPDNLPARLPAGLDEPAQPLPVQAPAQGGT